MKNAYRLTLNAPHQTVIMMVAVDTLVPLCAQIPTGPTNGGNKPPQVFDTERPDLPLFEGMIDQFATDLGLIITKPTSPMPKADYDRLKATAIRFWEARGGRTGTDKPKAQTAPTIDPDAPTWSTRSRSAEVQVETVTKPYTHIKEPAPFNRNLPKGTKGAQTTIILVPANKGDGRVVFDHVGWTFRPGPPMPGVSKAEQGLKAILRDEWSAKKLNQELLTLSKSTQPETATSPE